MYTKKTSKAVDSPGDKAMYLVVYTFLSIILLVVLYPIIYILSASFSSGAAVSSGQVILWPVEPTLIGYKAVFSYKSIMTGYRNTLFYTIVGTLINIVMTLIAAYPLSRPRFPGKRVYMVLFVITMFFNGGLIPTYILMTQIKFVNKVWAMLIPGAISTYNMIVTRTFFVNNIPYELHEAARIDGCSDTLFFFKILLPLSKAIIAVITLFYAVAHWNSYFNAMIYLRKPELYPLQIILRGILIGSRVDLSQIDDPEILAAMQGLSDVLKYSLIVVSSIPIIAIYPLAQKYFIQGVMVGSLKG